jgi:hypothetical protein
MGILTSKKILILGLSVAVIVAGYSWYLTRWLDNGMYLRWCVERQHALTQLGARVLNYAKMRDGRLPQDWGELIEQGIVMPDELEHDDGYFGVKICRTLRTIPNIDSTENLMLIVETYEPPQGIWTAFLLSGIAEAESGEGAYALKRDNERRVKCGLSPLPAPLCVKWSALGTRPNDREMGINQEDSRPN